MVSFAKFATPTAETMKTEIILIRHGETLFNVEGRMQGHSNSPLTDTGIRQAKATSKALAGETFDAAYSSPLGRARETAEIILNGHNCKLFFEEDLQERNLGVFQGLTAEEAAARFPEEYARYKKRDPDHVVPGGESARQFTDRGNGCIRRIAENHHGGRVLVISHGGILDGVFRHVLSIPPGQPRAYTTFNCAVNTIEREGDTWRLLTWGGIGHLKGIRSLDDE